MTPHSTHSYRQRVPFPSLRAPHSTHIYGRKTLMENSRVSRATKNALMREDENINMTGRDYPYYSSRQAKEREKFFHNSIMIMITFIIIIILSMFIDL